MADQATVSQIAAANPDASTWLSANAGSGKTRVLTNRVARLLLGGVSPQNILCLTYTKAAANEMQNRLFRTLGEWAMLGNDVLATKLTDLGVGASGDLNHARTLFARAIETPGGLRIQTIHSFCASLLRRFPLEAGVSPVFREIEDRAATLLRQEIAEEMASGDDADLVEAFAHYFTGQDFDRLTAEVCSKRDHFDPPPGRDQIWARLGVAPDLTESGILADTFASDDAPLLLRAVTILRQGKSTDQKAAEVLADLDGLAVGVNRLTALAGLFLYGSGGRIGVAKTDRMPTKELAAQHPEFTGPLHDLMRRVEHGWDQWTRLHTAKRSLALARFATVFLERYESRKASRGLLDFDDLIGRTRDLLTDRDVAQWVLYRLDGGIDHILVDEAQDTSPRQWEIIRQLAQEFSSGEGAKADIARTIFVVGDTKQSIYSFQGADPAEFERMCVYFEENLRSANQNLHRRALQHSFRSSSAILGLVDAVFANATTAHFTDTVHKAYFADQPGRVDLWPVVEPSKAPDEKHWTDPTDRLAENHHSVLLARKLAVEIKRITETESIVGEDQTPRPVRYGDFLVLVQRRGGLFHEIIRACKSLNLPIAGADRLKIGGELAVKDLTALLSFLVTPEDDLSLAAALRSPLFGLTEGDLFDLAHGRGDATLWARLSSNRERFPAAHETLTDLRNQTDFLSPFDLLERVLTRHAGRLKLLARLGQEAEEGIDAVLNQALDYEHSETPSLTGFLIWLAISEVEVKRQPDNAGDRIRVMTTHGAKGLESPIVILPDTAEIQTRESAEIVMLDDGLPIWKPSQAFQPAEIRNALDEARQRQREERERLLYVALTRAESWLIICAAGKISKNSVSWHERVRSTMEVMPATELETPTGPGMRLEHGVWPAKGAVAETTAPVGANLPDWASHPALPAPAPFRTVSPSTLPGDKFLPGEHSGLQQSDALLHGTRVHALLEHLPNVAPSDRSAVAAALAGDDKTAFAEVAPLIDRADLAEIFATDTLAEVPFSVRMDPFGDVPVFGTIDRLIVGDAFVHVVDFKSNRVVPESAETIPEGILRQMGAYLLAAESMFPDKAIRLSILWTNPGVLMPVPHDIVRQALRSTPTS